MRWGKRKSNKCELCGDIGSLHHILNNCKYSLDQGRLTWRHNSILSYLVSNLNANGDDTVKIYADLPGSQICGGTLPPNIITTSSKPDLVIISAKKIHIYELTCCFPTNITKANNFKMSRYAGLSEDLKNKGYDVELIPFEVTSLGHITKQNKASIKKGFKLCNSKINMKHVFQNLAKISLLCSFSIFTARDKKSWGDPEILVP